MPDWDPPPLLTVLAVPALIVLAGVVIALAQLVGLPT